MTDGKLDLLELADRLDAQVGETDDRISVSVETDLDEAFFVGTPAALTRMASALLRAAANRSTPQEVAGVSCRWSTHTHAGADGLAPVVLGAECVVLSDADRQRVVDHFRVLAGEQ
jgi:hypothetical protein